VISNGDQDPRPRRHQGTARPRVVSAGIPIGMPRFVSFSAAREGGEIKWRSRPTFAPASARESTPGRSLSRIPLECRSTLFKTESRKHSFRFSVFPHAGPSAPSLLKRKPMPDPTVRTVDSRGYDFDETSPSWKEECRALPCFKDIRWPDYDTWVVEDVIDGQPVVIQLWKGWCQQFLGRSDFPGGIGAEVGVYRRIPGKALPADLSFVPLPLRILARRVSHSWSRPVVALSRIGDDGEVFARQSQARLHHHFEVGAAKRVQLVKPSRRYLTASSWSKANHPAAAAGKQARSDDGPDARGLHPAHGGPRIAAIRKERG
jgi:hypothetical protein